MRCDMHVTFSTDCSSYQIWQSLVLSYTSTIVKQKGYIIRIASGCDEANKAELIASHTSCGLITTFTSHLTFNIEKGTIKNESTICRVNPGA